MVNEFVGIEKEGLGSGFSKKLFKFTIVFGCLLELRMIGVVGILSCWLLLTEWDDELFVLELPILEVLAFTRVLAGTKDGGGI